MWSLPRTPPAFAAERMDAPDADPALLRRALDGLHSVQRLTGGVELAAGPLRRTARRGRGRLRLLDVGAGGGRLGLAVARRVGDGRPVRTVLADLHPRTLALARERTAGRDAPDAPPGPDFVRLSAPALPFPSDSFDLALSATTLHHLERPEATACLRELDRVAGGRWVVTDLRRSAPALAAVRLLSWTVWRRNPYPRHDGPLSVRRAFTPEEIEEMLREVGLDGARVDRRGPVRLRAVGGGVP